MRINKNKYMIIISVVCCLLIIGSVLQYEKYKNTIGGYDICTMVNISYSIRNLINDDRTINEEYQERFNKEIMLYAHYLQKSPTLGFLSSYIDRIGYYSDNGYNKTEVQLLMVLDESIRSIMDEIEAKKTERIGSYAYNYFNDMDNLNELVIIADDIINYRDY